jgi:hypothetical protein
LGAPPNRTGEWWGAQVGLGFPQESKQAHRTDRSRRHFFYSATGEPGGRCFCGSEAVSVAADLSAVYCEGSRGNQSSVASHIGNCDRMLDLQRGEHLLRHHAGRLNPDWFAAAHEQSEAQADYLLCFQAGLPDV